MKRAIFSWPVPGDEIPNNAPCPDCPGVTRRVAQSYVAPVSADFPYGTELFRCDMGHEIRLHRIRGIEWFAPPWPEGLEPSPASNGQFDRQGARDARDEAIGRVEEAASQDWKTRAYEAVRRLAYEKSRICADDVWAVIEQPAEPRALGAVFQKAKRNGLIAPTRDIVQTERPVAHARMTIMWNSLVHGFGRDEATE